MKFRASGDVYRYFDVPGEEYAAFMAAESKGTYLNQVFKPREYRYVVVIRRQEDMGLSVPDGHLKKAVSMPLRVAPPAKK
jgi:hypothetical protein